MHNVFSKISSNNLNVLYPRLSDRYAAKTADIIELSNLYANKTGDFTKIWSSQNLTHAYLNYFMPLNWLRLKYVAQIALADGFFEGLDHVVEFGSGPGTFHFAATELSVSFASWSFIEAADAAIQVHRELLDIQKISSANLRWGLQPPAIIQPKSLAVFSYSLNEIENWPKWAENCQAVLIAEPATHDHGRRLQALRDELANKGWSIWAPCTHQETCPLLAHSPKDWCHQRLHIAAPLEMAEIETRLPMKNSSLTVSYLLARKDKPNPKLELMRQARVIGDTLFERGKVRQAVCRNSSREFLSWLTRHGEPELIENGARIVLPEKLEIKGNEIRLDKNFAATISTETRLKD